MRNRIFHFGLLLCFLSSGYCVAQQATIDSLLQYGYFDKAEAYIDLKEFYSEDARKLNKAKLFVEKNQLDSAFHYLVSIDSLQLNDLDRADLLYWLAKAYDSNNDTDDAFELYLLAQSNYYNLGNLKRANEINLLLYITLDAQKHFDYANTDFFGEFEQNAISNNWYDQIFDVHYEKAMLHASPEQKEQFDYHIEQALAHNVQNNKIQESRILGLKGIVYAEVFNDLKTALKIYKTLEKKLNDQKFYFGIAANYSNMASLFEKAKEYEKSMHYFKMADSVAQLNNFTGLSEFVYLRMADNFEKIQQPDSALLYLKKHLAFKDSVDLRQQNINLTRFQAERKELENFKLQNEVLNSRNKQRNTLIASSSLIFFSIVFGFLVFKNKSRKRKIIEQNHALKLMELEKQLAEQELATIDAMIQGQEAERKKIAAELHDNVGAMLAAAKAQLEYHISIQSPQDIEVASINKSYELLENAYVEVRQLAVVNNSGVFAQHGLIPSLQQLINNVSTPDLKFELKHYGLNKRMDNSVEIAIFRILQELISNIIKHSAASIASVSLTQNQNHLNIFVEDNGKGFNPKKAHPKSGFGLMGIKKRVDSLNGSLEIESSPNHGTTIIIDILL